MALIRFLSQMAQSNFINDLYLDVEDHLPRLRQRGGAFGRGPGGALVGDGLQSEAGCLLDRLHFTDLHTRCFSQLLRSNVGVAYRLLARL